MIPFSTQDMQRRLYHEQEYAFSLETETEILRRMTHHERSMRRKALFSVHGPSLEGHAEPVRIFRF
jgi:hypothetical protein